MTSRSCWPAASRDRRTSVRRSRRRTSPARQPPSHSLLRSPEWYAEKRVDLRLSTPIASILSTRPAGEPERRPHAFGEKFGFARLALTVGGRARRLRLPGADLDGVCYLRHLRNADELRERLAVAAHVVVVGGGFIGLEAAAAATGAGKDVTVVDIADRLLGRAVAPVVSEFYRHAHQRRGTRVLLRTSVAAIEASDDGRSPAAGRAARRRTAAARRPRARSGSASSRAPNSPSRLGLEVDNGIVVDSCARTSNPAVVAAGDCTTLPHPLTGEGRMRIESVQNAIAQAQAAAASLLGRPSATPAVPWFWSDQADLKLQIAGLSHGYDQVVVRGAPPSERFSVLYYACRQAHRGRRGQRASRLHDGAQGPR